MYKHYKEPADPIKKDPYKSLARTISYLVNNCMNNTITVKHNTKTNPEDENELIHEINISFRERIDGE